MRRVATSTFGVITVVGIIRGLVAQPQCSVVDRGGIVSVAVGVAASVIITAVYAVASTTSISSNEASVARAGAGVDVSIQMESI
jgi:hypothetical protein